MTSPADRSPVRTLTEALRALPADGLVRLLQLRPDLGYPLPTGMADLAARATTSTSVARAVDALNGWQRLVCEGLAASPEPVTVDGVAALLDRPVDAVATAVAALGERALCWGAPDVHVVRAVRDLWGPYPGGLAPPSSRPLDPDHLAGRLGELGDEDRAVLDRLVWGPPTGTVRHADRVLSEQTAITPVERLLARRLLRPLDADTVILPREVALALRAPAGLTRTSVEPEPPALTGKVRGVELVTRAAVGAAYALLHDTDLVAATLEDSSFRLLKAGGVATRDVAALARELGRDTGYAAFLLELLGGGGLIGPGDRGEFAPTAGWDRWAALPTPERWQRLFAAWTGLDRWPGLATEGGHPLGPELAVPRAAETRQLIMTQLESAAPGVQVDREQLLARTRWARPTLDRGGPPLTAVVAWTWREAEWLGLLALGSVSQLATSDPAAPLDPSLAALFPEPVEHLIVQSDLTAVAPGPLTSAVLGDLRRLADQESRGGGGVFRFSAGSLRRAFDAGWSADRIHGWLGTHASTAIPQPLTYLIDDVARRHGSIRVGTAACYVRCEDPTQTTLLLGHPEAGRLGLRLLAPGVLVGDAEPDEVVAFLRAQGLAPAAEDGSGVVLHTPGRRRGRPPGPTTGPPRIDAEEVAAVILAADARRPQRDPDAANGAGLASALRSLEEATRAETAVRVSYLSGDGTEAVAELQPLGLGAGVVRAVDPDSRRVVTIPLARISAVYPSPRGR